MVSGDPNKISEKIRRLERGDARLVAAVIERLVAANQDRSAKKLVD